MLKKYRSLCLPLFILAVACASIFQAQHLQTIRQPGEIITPQVYEYLIAGALALLCMGVLYAEGIKVHKQADSAQAKAGAHRGALIRILSMMGLCLLFAAGMRIVGFYVSAFLVIFVGYLAIEGISKKGVLVSCLFALGMCLVFYLVFQGFHIYLPKYLLRDFF